MPFLLQLLLRSLPLLAGFGGSAVTRGALGRLAPTLAKKKGVPFLSELLGFAGGEQLAEQIPGVPSHGGSFLERLPLLAAGLGGAHLAGGGLRQLAGKKGFGGLLKKGTGQPGFLPSQAAGLGGFIGGQAVGSQFLPQSEHEDQGAQEAMLHGNVDSASTTSREQQQFMELLSELQFQSEDEQRIDPLLIEQIKASALGQSLV